VLVLPADAGLPLHFSHGVPALASWEGQACAVLPTSCLTVESKSASAAFSATPLHTAAASLSCTALRHQVRPLLSLQARSFPFETFPHFQTILMCVISVGAHLVHKFKFYAAHIVVLNGMTSSRYAKAMSFAA
jgi:hypothetical protein